MTPGQLLPTAGRLHQSPRQPHLLLSEQNVVVASTPARPLQAVIDAEELVRRWNAHKGLVAALEHIAGQDDQTIEESDSGAYLRDMARAALGRTK